MLDFLSPKGLRAEVTEGIDLEHSIVLTGERVSVGSGPGDDLRLGAADIVPGHLTFERRADGKGWDYFSSDRGLTQVDRGNPRTGQVRAGMWFRVGHETRLDLLRAARPAAPDGKSDDGEPAAVPMPVAIGILGAMAVAGLVVMAGLGGGAPGGPSLRTTPWVTGAAALEPAIEECLATARAPTRAIAADDPASPYWRAMAFRGSDPVRAGEAEATLVGEVRGILASAHLLSRENRPLEASSTLRRLEYVLPVGAADCPILNASRFDLALLELRGSQ